MPSNQTQRPKFYEDQYLGAADLTAAVDYGRAQQARHVLGAHTWGIAIGLQLKERTQPGGAVSVHLLPGYAWDGYGRPIVVLEPYKIPEELFSTIKFDAAIDAGGKGRLIPVWLRYDETATRRPPPGFEACDSAGQFSRIEESFRIVIGEQPNSTDRYSGVTVGAKTLTDAKAALQTFDPAAPLVYDESIPQQTFPAAEDRARWLIPIGYVRWLPVLNQLGHFVARDDSGAGGFPKDSDQIRVFRRHIGVVTEGIEAADGRIRLKNRGKSFSSVRSDDLVWIEGDTRVEGDLRLFDHKLDFKDILGSDNGIPLSISRADEAGKGSLRAVIGQAAAGANIFAVGPLDAGNNFQAKVTVRDDGNVGIGTIAPTHSLHVVAADAVGLFESTGSQAYLRIVTNEGMKNRVEITNRPGGRLSLWTSGAGDTFNVTKDGNVGIGTIGPTHKFHVVAADAVGLFESLGDQAFLRLTTKEGLDKRVEITNRPGGRFSVWTLGGGDSFNVVQGGNVGIGTTAPLNKLHVLGNRIRLENSNKHVDLRADGSAVDLHSETNHLYVRSSGPGGNNNVIINPFPTDGNVGVGTETPGYKFEVNGEAAKTTGIFWINNSDRRLKKNIQRLEGVLSKLLRLHGVTYEWKEPEKFGGSTGPQMGLVAQDVEKVFPEWVKTDSHGYKHLSPQGLEAITIEALRELHEEIEQLKKRIQKLEGGRPGKGGRKKPREKETAE
jgi:hypothetical protein